MLNLYRAETTISYGTRNGKPVKAVITCLHRRPHFTLRGAARCATRQEAEITEATRRAGLTLTSVVLATDGSRHTL